MNKILICFVFLSQIVMASSELYENNDDIKQALNNNMFEPNYLTMFLGLFVVIALVYLTGVLYQKLTKIKLSENDDDTNKINIVSSVNLGQNRSLYIVKVNDEYTLIGATQNKITALKEIKQDNKTTGMTAKYE